MLPQGDDQQKQPIAEEGGCGAVVWAILAVMILLIAVLIIFLPRAIRVIGQWCL
mgnify:CR=1 FL=1